MKKLSSKSKARVIRLLRPPTARTGVDFAAPRGLTVRQLLHQRRRAHLRRHASLAEIAGGHLVSLGNLQRLGFDFYG